MLDTFTDWFAAPGLLPLADCLARNPALMTLHVAADALIALAYCSIPLALGVFIRRRTDLALPGIFFLCGAFILAGGAAHGFSIWTVWRPDYLAEGLFKALTAVLSIATAISLWSMRQKALALPSPGQLTRVNAELTRKVLEHEAMVHRLEVEAKLRLHLEKQLRDSEQQLKSVLETAADGILTTDARGRLQICNPAAARMFGYAPAELTGQPMSRLITPHTEAAGADPGQPAVTDATHEFVGHHKDGSTFPVEVTLGGNTSVIRDITQRKAQDRAIRELNNNLERKVLERTEQLAHASAAKSLFLANMSHELRTPMNAILGLVEVLEHGDLTTDQRDILAKMRLSGSALTRIIDDILDITKIEAGQIRVEKKPFDLAATLREHDDLMRGAAEAKGIRLNIHQPDIQPGLLMGDSARLQQVLTNLTGNAIKFTTQGQVVVDVMTVRDTPDALRLRFEVRDTGIGIDPKTLPNLFMPFSQADETITRRFGGTGLGLAISKRLVELMGGTIDVTSRVGEGSTFRFELPFQRDASQPKAVGAQPEPATAGPRLDNLRVLVVDDSAMNRFMVERILKLQGALTTLAEDGQEALKLLKSGLQTFDVVLMDIQMPVMDGLTATRAIRADAELAGQPVIAFTAGVLEEERKTALAAGFNGFLTKPVNLEALIRALSPYRPNGGPAAVASPLASQPAPASPPPAAPPMAATPLPPPTPPTPPPPLEMLPGVDLTAVLGMLGGDRELLAQVFSNFIQEFGDFPAAAREALAQGEREPLARQLHTLKGTAANLGLHDLARQAAALETAVKAGQPPEALLANLSETLVRLLPALRMAATAGQPG